MHIHVGCCYYLLVGKLVYSDLAMKLRSSLSGSTKLCGMGLRSCFQMTIGGIKARKT